MPVRDRDWQGQQTSLIKYPRLTLLYDMKKETEAAVFQGQLKTLTLMQAQDAAPRNMKPTFCMQYLL